MRPLLGIALLTTLTGAWCEKPAFAGTPVVGVHAGVGFPTGEFSDAWDRGATVGLSYTYGINAEWGIGADISYLRSDPSEQRARALEATGGTASFHYVQYGVHLRWSFPVGSAPARPYLEAGPGIYDVQEEFESQSGTESDSQTAVGVRGGGGIDIVLTDWLGVMAMGMYHHVVTEEDGIPHDTTPYFSITGGFRFRLGAY